MTIKVVVATDNRRALISFRPSWWRRMFGARTSLRVLVFDEASHRWRFERSGVEAPRPVLIAIGKAMDERARNTQLAAMRRGEHR